MNNEDQNQPTPPNEPVAGPAPQPAPEEPTNVDSTLMTEPAQMPAAQTTDPSMPQAPVSAPEPAVFQPSSDTTVVPPSPIISDQPQAPVAPSEPSSPQVSQAEHHTDGLGIASIIMAFTGLQLIGFILGLIGSSHAKKQGRSATLSRIGWILNLVIGGIASLVIVGLILASFQGAQAKARDTERMTDINAIYAKLEEAYNTNGYYPGEVSAANLPGIDSAALKDPKGGNYTYTPSPTGCTQCASYTLSAPLEQSSDKTLYGDTYKKESLFDSTFDPTGTNAALPTSKL